MSEVRGDQMILVTYNGRHLDAFPIEREDEEFWDVAINLSDLGYEVSVIPNEAYQGQGKRHECKTPSDIWEFLKSRDHVQLGPPRPTKNTTRYESTKRMILKSNLGTCNGSDFLKEKGNRL
jgi:hypothetical protein